MSDWVHNYLNMQDNEILIDVQNVSKRFCKDLKRSIRYGFMDSLRAISKQNLDASTLRKDEFWAVKDVSLQLRRGECLGLIGHNGAGKSTLLKMLNGLINPDHGSITIYGKIAALIELGAGFNPVLTGRENIYNNGAVLGFGRKEIDAKMEEIIDFAEIRDFIDAPVQNYSSGMKVRLGFAVAAQMEPDVLLIDEVLAVGDIGFRIKCLNRISELLKKCAVIFVSHSMPQVSRICTKGVLMEHGVLKLNTLDLGELIEGYYSSFSSEKSSVIGNGKTIVSRIEMDGFSSRENGSYIFNGEEISITLKLLVQEDVQRYIVHAIVHDIETKPIAMSSSLSQNKIFCNNNNEEVINLSFPTIFSDGTYTIDINVSQIEDDNRIGEVLVSNRNVLKFIISKNTFPTSTSIQLPTKWQILK